MEYGLHPDGPDDIKMRSWIKAMLCIQSSPSPTIWKVTKLLLKPIADNSRASKEKIYGLSCV